MKNIERNLKTIRKIFQYTQNDIADMLHVTRQAVSRWEVGDVVPNVDFLQELCQIYHLSMDELIDPNLSAEVVHERYVQVKKEQEKMITLSDKEIEPNIFLRFIKTRHVGFYFLIGIAVLMIAMACVYSSYFNRLAFVKYHHFSVELFLSLGIVVGLGMSISKFTNKFAGYAMMVFDLLAFLMFIKYGYMYFTELFFAGVSWQVITEMDPGYMIMIILFVISFILLIAVQFIPQYHKLKAKTKTKE